MGPSLFLRRSNSLKGELSREAEIFARKMEISQIFGEKVLCNP